MKFAQDHFAEEKSLTLKLPGYIPGTSGGPCRSSFYQWSEIGSRDPGPDFGSFNKNILMLTPPKFNIAPENGWLEYYFPIGKVTFQGLC